MKDIKCFVFDVDGTLKENHKTFIEETNLKMLKQLKHTYTVVIATGRSLSTVPETLLTIADYFICSNGTVIFDRNLKKIMKIVPHTSEIQQVINYCYANEINFGYKDATDGYFVNINGTLPEYLERETDLKIVNQVETPEDRILSLFVDFTHRDCKHLLPLCTNLNFDDSGWETNGIVHYEIYSKNSGKLASTDWLCNYLGIELENVMAFGDSGNDIELLKNVKYGILMGNAKPQFKKLGLQECDTNANMGIVKYLAEKEII